MVFVYHHGNYFPQNIVTYILLVFEYSLFELDLYKLLMAHVTHVLLMQSQFWLTVLTSTGCRGPV